MGFMLSECSRATVLITGVYQNRVIANTIYIITYFIKKEL